MAKRSKRPERRTRAAGESGPTAAKKAATKRPAAAKRANGGLFADLKPNPANFAPLTPIAVLPRTAAIHPERVAVVHGTLRLTYKQLLARTRRLGSALVKHGVRPGDTVSAMLPNIPAMLEVHFGVPMTGAVLNTINTRLDPATIAYILEHGEAKVLITDREYAAQVGPALARMKKPPRVKLPTNFISRPPTE